MSNLPTGGAGPFRLTSELEQGTGLAQPPGFLQSFMRLGTGADSVIFYSTSPAADAASPRSLSRSMPGRGPRFVEGSVVLEASAAWEGGSITDPWAVTIPSGSVRLYYAGQGGIGLAEAPNAQGTFTRVGAAPVIAGTGLRRPSIVAAPSGGYLLYVDNGSGFSVARSTDGVSFEPLQAIALGQSMPDDAGPAAGDAGQSTIASPAAVVWTPRVGESVIRLFFETRLPDGTRQIDLAGSRDGLVFERALQPAYKTTREDPANPAAVVISPDEVLLYFTTSGSSASVSRRALVSVSPGSVRYDAPDAGR